MQDKLPENTVETENVESTEVKPAAVAAEAQDITEPIEAVEAEETEAEDTAADGELEDTVSEDVPEEEALAGAGSESLKDHHHHKAKKAPQGPKHFGFVAIVGRPNVSWVLIPMASTRLCMLIPQACTASKSVRSIA